MKSSPPDPVAMWTALIDPVRLQVFAALVTCTGPGRREQFTPAPGTRSVAYLTPTGAANRTGISVEDARDALQALQDAGLAIPSETTMFSTPGHNGWRLATDNLVTAAGREPSQWIS